MRSISVILILSIFAAASASSGKCFPCNGHPLKSYYARNPRGCAWLFTCNPGQPPVESMCPFPYYYHHEKQACDWPENVADCETPPPSTSCPDKGFAIIPHPATCSKFIVCSDGAEEDRDCEPGLHYSPTDGQCVTPVEARCQIDRAFCEANYPTAPHFPKIANTRDCREWFTCANNNVVVHRCASGQHFDDSTGFCDVEAKVQCTSSIARPAENLPANVNLDCSSEADGAVHFIADSCDFWFFCAGGRSFLQRCGDGTKFDVHSLRCVAKDTDGAECATELTPAGGRRDVRQMLSHVLQQRA